ncbi:MAG TPA: MarR family transcriptional regulator [Rhizomicrobium sp.]|jgi:DNA-binding MarR family transcriptional regulator|nr:MarR family transcriptional regulator [Rhizomicrobium sp.]
MANNSEKGTLERDLLIVLHDVARLTRTRFDQAARAFGMTRAQWIILARLDRQPGISQNELATICEVEPITVARLVDRLEARGMMERRPDPNDRRVRRLHLLPASAPILKEIARHKNSIYADLTDGIDQETLNTMLDGLLQMKSKLTSEPANDARLAMAGE